MSTPARKVTDPQLRFRVLERDRFTCQYCGQSAPNVKLECDHILPVTRGGKTEYDNLVAACVDCNRGKSDTIISANAAPWAPAVLASQPTVAPAVSDVVPNGRYRLRRTEAAAYVVQVHGMPCSPKTLAKLACLGGGPSFCKAGRYPLYTREALDAWATSKISVEVAQTSELSAPKLRVA